MRHVTMRLCVTLFGILALACTGSNPHLKPEPIGPQLPDLSIELETLGFSELDSNIFDAPRRYDNPTNCPKIWVSETSEWMGGGCAGEAGYFEGVNPDLPNLQCPDGFSHPGIRAGECGYGCARFVEVDQSAVQ